MNPRNIVLFAALVSAVWAFRNWRAAVKGAMVLLVLEGALRKWVFPGAQDLLYFAKDVVLASAFVGFLADSRARQRWRPPPAPVLYAALALSVVIGLFQIFNPRLPNLLVGILGFKAYFLYVPLMFVLPWAFQDDRELARFLRRYLLLAIPVGLLAILQFMAPASSALNTYARAGEGGDIARFGSSTHVRVTGTFAFISGYVSYLLASSVLALAILGTMGWRLRGALLVYSSLALTLLGMLMTGSRGPVLVFLGLVPVYWWFAVVRERGAGATVGRLLLVSSVLCGLLIGFGDEALNAFVGRSRASQDTASRLASPFVAPWAVLPQVGLLGYGVGATHQTAAAVTKSIVPYSWMRGLRLEAESGRVMAELGALGFVLIYFLRCGMAVFALRQILRLRTRFHRALATAALLVFLAQIPGGIVFEVTSGVLYWFFAGLLMTAIRLDTLAQAPKPATAGAAVIRQPAGAARMPPPRPALPAGLGGRWQS